MDWKRVIEALIFSSPKPLGVREIAAVLRNVSQEESVTPSPSGSPPSDPRQVEQLVEELAKEYEAEDRSFLLVGWGGKWQFVTRPEYAPWLKVLHGERVRPGRLSQAALETLTIIAYRQPVTRAEIEEIRGVSIDGVLQTLIERGLVRVVGRSELPGRPMLYGTTSLFLEAFGLRNLDELPAAEELRACRPKRMESAPSQEENEEADPSRPSREASDSNLKEEFSAGQGAEKESEPESQYDD